MYPSVHTVQMLRFLNNPKAIHLPIQNVNHFTSQQTLGCQTRLHCRSCFQRTRVYSSSSSSSSSTHVAHSSLNLVGRRLGVQDIVGVRIPNTHQRLRLAFPLGGLLILSSSSFSSSSAKSKTSKATPETPKTSPPPQSPQSPLKRRLNWNTIVRILKIARIPALVVSVYTLGYQQGTIDYATNPKKQEKILLQSILSEFGVVDISETNNNVQKNKENDNEDDDSAHNNHNNNNEETNWKIQTYSQYENKGLGFRHSRSSRGTITLMDGNDYKTSAIDPRLVRVSNVGKRIIQAALIKMEQEFEKTLGEVIENYYQSNPPHPSKTIIKDKNNNVDYSHSIFHDVKLQNEISKNEQLQFWSLALDRIQGSWDFTLINSPLPNAFVSEVFPKRIFITTGLFNLFVSNDDELALILGHEISHLIYAHNSQKNQMELMLRALEVLCLSLDPTDGFMSLVFMGMLGFIRQVVTSAQSRENEGQADELGMILTAMACFDTKVALEVFRKMLEFDNLSIEKGLAGEKGKEEEGGGGGEKEKEKEEDNKTSFLNILSTHPPTKERLEYFITASEVENIQKYENTTCQDMKRSFWKMLKLSSS